MCACASLCEISLLKSICQSHAQALCLFVLPDEGLKGRGRVAATLLLVSTWDRERKLGHTNPNRSLLAVRILIARPFELTSCPSPDLLGHDIPKSWGETAPRSSVITPDDLDGGWLNTTDRDYS